MVTIPSGSFFLPQYIASKIASNTISEDEVSYAIKHGVEDAIEYKFSSVEDESNEWFYLAKILAETDKETAFKLATIYHIEGDNKQAIYWYKNASKLNHKKASAELIDLYIDEGELLAAKALLFPLKHEEDALYKLIDISVSLGDLTLLNELILLIKKSNSNELVKELQRYRIVDTNLFNRPHSEVLNVNECSNTVQLFATSLSHLNKLDTLLQNIKDHPLSSFICFEPPRYISVKQLDCKYNKGSAIKCDDSIWSHVTSEINTRYIGLMLDKGGANVDNGILYLDASDNTQVFIHELSHLLGFIDEYPLPVKHKVCQKPQQSSFSHNISIMKPHYKGSKEEVLDLLEKQVPWFSLIDAATPILIKGEDKWIIGTPESYKLNNENVIGLFKSETCDKNKVQAFKPTSTKTSLRYYEESFIPLYTNLLIQRPDQYLMPSFHYNVAKALFKKNKENLGLKWLNKALSRELEQAANSDHSPNKSSINRYNKMKRGEY
ncbi:tetratricopeptide repeat protein [Pseudocolwellia sp. HL-MZ7]|uniref:tetratricopeptide repeat protein n=1 Tax=Pseudocolwellia sp. HL-MZ7 TaxID=3400627 RepID=UPI003CE7509F